MTTVLAFGTGAMILCGATAALADDVKPPVAADLAKYTKELQATGKTLEATITTPLGTLHCELFADRAPVAVANFVGLATGKKPYKKDGKVTRGKFYDGLIFHRVIPDFMIQGGDPTGTGTGGPGYEFDDEKPPAGAEMGPGALAMANRGVHEGKGTNGSQFFVMEGSAPHLVGKHTIFGQCKEVDVVTKITHTPRGDRDRPDTPVTMKISINAVAKKP
jgi:cyclophilin family peptidyl-prolyl cis-trans isomerase